MLSIFHLCSTYFILPSSFYIYSTSIPFLVNPIHLTSIAVFLFHLCHTYFNPPLSNSLHSTSIKLSSIHLYQTLFIPLLSNSLHSTSIKLSSFHLYQPLFIPPLSNSLHSTSIKLSSFHLYFLQSLVFSSHLYHTRFTSTSVPFLSPSIPFHVYCLSSQLLSFQLYRTPRISSFSSSLHSTSVPFLVYSLQSLSFPSTSSLLCLINLYWVIPSNSLRPLSVLHCPFHFNTILFVVSFILFLMLQLGCLVPFSRLKKRS